MKRVINTVPEQTSPALYSLQFWLTLAVIFVFAILLKVPSLSFPHEERDEQVYVTLAQNLLTRGTYNIQDTPILYDLSPAIYDHPLFFHPPLFPFVVAGFLRWGSARYAVLASWLGHLLCILAVAVLARRLTTNSSEDSRNSLVDWLPAIAVASDPLLCFVSRRLWIDGLLAGLAAAALAAFFCANYSRRRTLWIIIGSLLLGLAILAKTTALLFVPLVIYLILTPEVRRRSWAVELCLGLLPAAIVVAPWFLIFYRTYGTLFPAWIKPDDWTLQHYPFVLVALARTPGYYLWKMASIAPVSIIALGTYFLRPSLFSRRSLLGPIWLLLYFGGMAAVGSWGMGFQMRYLTPAVPAIYVMLAFAMPLLRRGGVGLQACTLLLVIAGAMTSAVYLVTPHFDEILNIIELARMSSAPS